ncbi:hypothetical protein C5167_034137 [Papaver somniferum]|uniref:Uncharacterized protein n=1 Tax=Papaver somniferum TaxID=3469 RepID=A0A4Y7KAD6_PAPSO|nr:uncharacterized protein LOC113294642 [Papaver somniferum]RZC69302.1 hypothetical protein C5167_034137 [Papaver somniferum]
MWSWEHYRAYRSEFAELDFEGERIVTAEDGSDQIVTYPISYPRTALYEKITAKPSVRLAPLLDNLEEFTFFPYDDGESGEISHRFSSLFPEDFVDTQLDSPSYEVYFVVAVTPGYLPGYYKGEFYAEAYNLNRMARQAGFDQGTGSFLVPACSADLGVIEESFMRSVFKNGSPRFCRPPLNPLKAPQVGRELKVTHQWCLYWLKEMKNIHGALLAAPMEVPSTALSDLHPLGRFKLPQAVMRLHNLGFSAKGKRLDAPLSRSKFRSKPSAVSKVQAVVRDLSESLPPEPQRFADRQKCHDSGVVPIPRFLKSPPRQSSSDKGVDFLRGRSFRRHAFQPEGSGASSLLLRPTASEVSLVPPGRSSRLLLGQLTAQASGSPGGHNASSASYSSSVLAHVSQNVIDCQSSAVIQVGSMPKHGRNEGRESTEKSKKSRTLPRPQNDALQPITREVSLAEGGSDAPLTFLIEGRPIERSFIHHGEEYVSLHGFWVPPHLEALYTQIVFEHGHIGSGVVLPEANVVTSLTLTVLDVVNEMADAGDHPSSTQLQAWRRVIDNATKMKFNVAWLDDLSQELDVKANSRRPQLPSIIEGHRKRIIDIAAFVAEFKATQYRLIQESVDPAEAMLEEEKRLLGEVEVDLGNKDV